MSLLTWKQPFSDNMIFFAVNVMASGEQLIKLVIWMSIIIKAILPQPHVIKRSFCSRVFE